MRYLGHAWASPNTLLGISLGLASMTPPHREAGAINFYMTSGPVYRVCCALRIAAFTLGDCVLYAVPPTPNLRVHEGRHIAQYHALGPFFLPAYYMLLAYFGYEEHPLEVDARHHEHLVCGSIGPSQLRPGSLPG